MSDGRGDHWVRDTVRRLDLLGQTALRPVRDAALRAGGRTSPELNERSVEYAFVFRRLAMAGSGTLLDVGTGRSAFPALAELAGWQVTAVDNVVDYWPTGPLGVRWGFFNPHFSVLDIDLARDEIGKFDVVTCISTFEHVVERDGLFGGMARSLSDQGELILTTPYSEKGGVPNAYELPGSDLFGRSLAYGCRVMDREDLDRYCEEFDLMVEAMEYWRFFDGPFWRVGRQLDRGEQVEAQETHQIACIALRPA